jgi:predicted NBD/HSP70 family sugar kinase
VTALSDEPRAVAPDGRPASALPPPEGSAGSRPGLFAARPSLIRAMNEQLLLEYIRQRGPCSRAELARASGLSKPTVSLALGNVERAGLVRIAGQRTGVPGRSARLYEIRPDAGLVLGLDIGHEYVRGAIADLTGEIRTRASVRARATSVRSRVAELVELADLLCHDAGVSRLAVTQTVIGSPGVYDPRRNSMKLTGVLRGWDRPAALAGLREAFGPSLVMENDVDAAALAERALGHGREVDNFAFVHIGTGIGMGLVLGGQLLRGAHGVAGEIAYMPLSGGAGSDSRDARKRGMLEAAASASGIVRAARRGGMRGPVSARRVFEAAANGDERAQAVVAEEARLVARTICAIVTVVDPDLIVLGGGIGRAPGFAESVGTELDRIAPVMPAIRVSALGTDAVVDGCLVAGTELAWASVMTALPTDTGRPASGDGFRPLLRAQVGGPVDVEDRAAGPLGLIGGEVDDGGGDFLGRRHPVERALRADLVAAGGVQVGGRHLGFDVPRRHRGDRDAVRRECAGHRLPERVQARLAGTVGRVPGLAPERAAGAHVDDPAALFLHVLDGAPGHVRGRGEVDRDRVAPHVLPLLVGHLGDRVPYVDPCVVDQDVQTAQRVRGPVHHRPHGAGVGQVGADNHVAGAGQAGQHLLREPGRVAMMHRHPVALAGERLRHRPADAAGSPRHQDRAPGRRHFPSHRASSLVAVVQFLAVAATPPLPGGPMMRKSTWDSSLVP